MSQPRYPDCRVDLLETSANAVSIIMKTRRGIERHLREQDTPREQIDAIVQEFMEEAQSGDYDSVLITAFRWVDVR